MIPARENLWKSAEDHELDMRNGLSKGLTDLIPKIESLSSNLDKLSVKELYLATDMLNHFHNALESLDATLRSRGN